MQKKKVYFISGLGADKTVFQLLDVGYCEPVFIDWIKPEKNEPLPHYALRLKKEKGIPDDALIVGLSFGGMLSTEICKAFPKTFAVLLSSSKTRKEIPALYHVGTWLPAYKWLPDGLQKLFMRGYEGKFGVYSKKGKEIYQKVIVQADISFNKWAVWALLHWQNMEVPPNVVHVHGTDDKILYYKNVAANITVQKGGHLMVMENAGEVSAILKRLLLKEQSFG